MLLHRLFGNDTLSDEDVNQVLQGLHILLADEVVVHGHRAKVDKAAVQVGVAAEMPEWVGEVVVVEMGVATEHLLDDGLDIGMVVLREARRLADPFVCHASQSRQWLVETGWRSGDRIGGTRITNITRDEGMVDRSWGSGRECLLIVNLADNPALDSNDVLRGRDLSRAPVLEPGVRETANKSVRFSLAREGIRTVQLTSLGIAARCREAVRCWCQPPE
jgi:hypothetical protein